MNTIPARQIKRRGLSGVDELLKNGPVYVTKNNRPRYVVMTDEDYRRLTERRRLWKLVDRPARGTRSKEDIDTQTRAERDGWDSRSDRVSRRLHHQIEALSSMKVS